MALLIPTNDLSLVSFVRRHLNVKAIVKDTHAPTQARDLSNVPIVKNRSFAPATWQITEVYTQIEDRFAVISVERPLKDCLI